jgi:hypothetical protein
LQITLPGEIDGMVGARVRLGRRADQALGLGEGEDPTEEAPTTMSAAATATATLARWHARHRSPAPREPHIAALPLVEPTPNAIA